MGRVISIPLKFDKFDNRGKKLKGSLNLLISSLYHPVDTKEHNNLSDILVSFFKKHRKKQELIIGHDINANVGTRDPQATYDYNNVLGPHGIDNRNPKGTSLLMTLSIIDVRITNIFFTHDSHVRGVSFSGTRSPHMLDVISVSPGIFQNMKDDAVVKIGVKWDHSAFAAHFTINSIKKQKKQPSKSKIDWKNIINHGPTNFIYNHILESL